MSVIYADFFILFINLFKPESVVVLLA